jgi:hypothetical protein
MKDIIIIKIAKLIIRLLGVRTKETTQIVKIHHFLPSLPCTLLLGTKMPNTRAKEVSRLSISYSL